MKRAQQNLFPLRRLKIIGMGPQILKKFYNCTIESITAWYGSCSASDRKALQRVVRTAQYITGAKLPAIRTYIIGAVRGKPIIFSETPVTQVIDCFLCYRTASGT